MVRESKLVPACSTETTKIVIMTKGVQRLGLGDCFFIVVRVMFVCVCGGGPFSVNSDGGISKRGI